MQGCAITPSHAVLQLKLHVPAWAEHCYPCSAFTHSVTFWAPVIWPSGRDWFVTGIPSYDVQRNKTRYRWDEHCSYVRRYVKIEDTSKLRLHPTKGLPCNVVFHPTIETSRYSKPLMSVMLKIMISCRETVWFPDKAQAPQSPPNECILNQFCNYTSQINLIKNNTIVRDSWNRTDLTAVVTNFLPDDFAWNKKLHNSSKKGQKILPSVHRWGSGDLATPVYRVRWNPRWLDLPLNGCNRLRLPWSAETFKAIIWTKTR